MIERHTAMSDKIELSYEIKPFVITKYYSEICKRRGGGGNTIQYND